MERILMVDDDRELFQILQQYLSLEAFELSGVHEGTGGVAAALSGDYALVLLDVMLPNLNGFDVLRQIRGAASPHAHIPVLMLTARGDAVDRIVGLEVGADDYLPKPFNERELVAHMRAILRRAPLENAPVMVDNGAKRLRVDEVSLDSGERRVWRDEIEIDNAHERIGTEIVCLNDLIGQLLQLARLENLEHSTTDSSAEAEKSLVDLSALVRAIVADAQFEASEKSRSITAHLTPCNVRGNSALLHSAIENVVRNAIRHTPESTQVEIDLGCENGVAKLGVRDWGAGVPEASLSEIFQPFYRVETARDRESGGAGLGLSITDRAARWHNGSVRAENVSPHGLRVEIRLPMVAETPDQASVLL